MMANWRTFLLIALAALALPVGADAGSRDLVISMPARLPEQYEGATLFVEELNAAGGIGGRPVRLVTYEDGFSMDRALANARTIVGDNETLAVIGHSGSAVSLAAAKLYAEVGLAAVTPFSTNDRVTKGNPLYFRTTFTDGVQGEVLAHYARNVLGARTVTIVNDDGTYGSFVADVFAATAARTGLNVARRITVKADVRDEELLSDVGAVARGLAQAKPESVGLVFVAGGAKTSAATVMAIRSAQMFNPILLPDEGASAHFLNAITSSPRSALFARDVYVSSPFIFDIGGPRAQDFRQRYLARTGREPTYQTAYAYDAMAVVAEALRHADLAEDGIDLAEKRRRVRDALAAIDTVQEAVAGITGPLYFDADRNAVGRIISVGEIRNGAVVSSVAQLREVHRADDDPRALDAMVGRGELIRGANGHLFAQTNVAYTGIHMKRIDAVDFDAGTFNAEFDLWFRAHREIDGARIAFSNAADAVAIEETRHWRGDGGMVYQLFTVKGRFRMDTTPGTNLLREHAFAVQFHHRDLPASSLLFIKDWMEDERRTAANYRENGLLASERGWTIAGVSYFQNTFARNTLGDTTRAGPADATIEHSRFNAVLQLKKDAFALSDLLPGWGLAGLLWVVAGGTLTLGVIHHRSGGHSALLASYVATMALLYIARESVIAYHTLAPEIPAKVAGDVLTGLAAAAWLISAHFLNRWVGLTLWRAIERKDGHAVPVLMRRVVMAVIYVAALFGVVSFVLGRDLTSLLATSGVVAMILGLALQPNLANIFSGIALNLEKPFKIGDWIEFRVGSDPAVGRVEDMTWRTTKIVTADGTHVSVPNGALANVNINNLGPSRTVKGTLKVILDARLEPGTVTEALRAVAAEIEGASGIKVEVLAIEREQIEYAIKVSHDALQGDVPARTWRRIWEALHDLDPAARERTPEPA